jgi:hypothetical protein
MKSNSMAGGPFSGQNTIDKVGSMGGSGGIGNTKTFSSLANIPKFKMQRLISEAKSMIGGARKCKEIWHANIKLVFEKCKDQIFELLRLANPTEFIEVFDYGGDGLLNEDEQVLLFSIIKEKM